VTPKIGEGGRERDIERVHRNTVFTLPVPYRILTLLRPSQNEKLESEMMSMAHRVEKAENQADNYRLAFEEFKEERESLLKYWKQDQAKLQKLVGPNYDEIELGDVRLMDLNTVVSMANPAAVEAMDAVNVAPEMSPFQRRMQERTRSLQSSLANETKVLYRMNPDGTLRPPSPVKADKANPADPNRTQCYYSPLDGCFHPLSAEEKAAASQTGAGLAKAQLHQESEEVRQLQRRVAELEFTATSAGITEEEVDELRVRVGDASGRIETAESAARELERRAKQLEAELVVARSGGGGGGGDQVTALSTRCSGLEQELQEAHKETLRITEQAATEKEMFITIATGLETEVKETKQAMEQVLEEYPHLKTMVSQAMPEPR